jgi:Ca2+-binding EF-hand superfamily protein
MAAGGIGNCASREPGGDSGPNAGLWGKRWWI